MPMNYICQAISKLLSNYGTPRVSGREQEPPSSGENQWGRNTPRYTYYFLWGRFGGDFFFILLLCISFLPTLDCGLKNEMQSLSFDVTWAWAGISALPRPDTEKMRGASGSSPLKWDEHDGAHFTGCGDGQCR